jgi:hypothetical protein
VVLENQRVSPIFSKVVCLLIILIYILIEIYSKQNVKTAMKDAKAELKRHKGLSKNQKKKSDLKPFGNRDHQLQLPGAAGPNSLPKAGKKNLMEFPLKNGREPAGEKGPARVILKKNIFGQLKFKGVVAHDQNRLPQTLGYNDHFKIKGRY